MNFKLLLPALVCTLLLDAQPGGMAERLRQAISDQRDKDLALQEFAARDYASLEALLKSRTAIPGPNAAEIKAIEASVAFLAGDMSKSIDQFTEAASLVSIGDNDRFTWAMAYVKVGDSHRAVELLSGLSSKHPDQALYVYWLGRIDYDQRLYLEAVKKFQKAISLDPQSARIWNALGLAYDMEGQMEPAYDSFAKASRLNRELAQPSPWPPHDLGVWFLRMSRLKAAERAFSEALKYDPAMPEAHYHLARTLEKEGRDAEAIVEYKTAVANDLSSPDACYALAMLYRRVHRDAESSAMLAEYKARKSRS